MQKERRNRGLFSYNITQFHNFTVTEYFHRINKKLNFKIIISKGYLGNYMDCKNQRN